MGIFTGPFPAHSRWWRTKIVAVLIVVVAAIVALAAYLIWSSYHDAIRGAETTSRNYAAVIEARLDAALQRADSDLLNLGRSLPASVFGANADAQTRRKIDAQLRALLTDFPEIDGLGVYNADGDLLYTTTSQAPRTLNIGDRAYFRQARASNFDALIVSNVIIGHISKRRTLILAHAVRDERGRFIGTVNAALDLDYFQRLFQSLDVGPHGVIAVVRRDNFHLISRWPPANMSDLNRALPQNIPARIAFAAGKMRGTAQIDAPLDKVVRIFSFEALDRYPFYVTVGLARVDILANPRGRAIVIGATSFLALALVATLLYFLWRDISARAAAERELAAARETLADAFESVEPSIALYDKDDRLVLHNRRLMLQEPKLADVATIGSRFQDIVREAIDRDLIALPSGTDRENFVAAAAERHRRAAPKLATIRYTDGRIHQVVTRPARNGGVITVGSDVTEQLQVEERLREAQKMEAIGKLTGGMAHDFNNYLGVIIGNLEMVADDRSIAPEARKLIDSALSGALRAADLTRSLLAFSRQQPLVPRRINVSQSLASIAALLDRTIGEDVTVLTSLAQDVWPVRIDGAQLDSCVVNLANNGRDAMPRGGTLTIATRNTELDARYAETHPDVVSGDYVVVEVSDTGTGMSAETIARAFEPFFTTKPAGRGTGLGLSMVYGFVKQSGGHVSIYSETGRGTVVRLYLPRDREAGDDTSLAAALPTDRPAAGSETILVVEDKEAMRRTVTRQLASLGYRVLEAENAAAALDILRKGEPKIDLLFTDIVMPGNLDGYELAERAMDMYPAIKIVVTSGFPGEALPHNGSHRARLRMLTKPYRQADLKRAIREALDG